MVVVVAIALETQTIPERVLCARPKEKQLLPEAKCIKDILQGLELIGCTCHSTVSKPAAHHFH